MQKGKGLYLTRSDRLSECNGLLASLATSSSPTVADLGPHLLEGGGGYPLLSPRRREGREVRFTTKECEERNGP